MQGSSRTKPPWPLMISASVTMGKGKTVDSRFPRTSKRAARGREPSNGSRNGRCLYSKCRKVRNEGSSLYDVIIQDVSDGNDPGRRFALDKGSFPRKLPKVDDY